MQGGDCLVPRTIGYDTINGWLAVQKKSTQTGNLCLISSFREHLFVALMTPGLIIILQAPRLISFGLLKKIGCSERDRHTLIGHSPASEVP